MDIKFIQTTLSEMKDKQQKIVLLFKYPNLPRLIRKSGFILKVEKDFFILDDIRDGESILSYEYLVEINKKDDYDNYTAKENQ